MSKLWLTDDPALDEAGYVVRGGLFLHQRDWWELPNFIKALVTGYGGGKTLVGAKRIIASALENAPIPVAVVSPSYKMARRTVIRSIKELLDGKIQILRNFRYQYSKAEFEFTVRYHGREGHIWVMSGEDPDALKGPNLAAAWIDEPFLQEREVFLQMLARVRDPQARLAEILLTGTPEQLNWGYDICEGEEVGNYDIGLVQASTRANLALNQQYVERLESAYSDKAAAAYVDGLFVNLGSGQVYYAFDKRVNVQELDIPEGEELGLGLDFNVNPMAGTIFWKNKNHIHFIDEFELPNADTEYACDYAKELYGDRLTYCCPDATGKNRSTKSPGGRSDFHYITAAGLEIFAKHANPHRKDRYNATNGTLKPREGEPRMTVSSKCKKLIKYMSTHTHELMNKQDYMTHLLDAATYPVAYFFPVIHEPVKVQKLRGH